MKKKGVGAEQIIGGEVLLGKGSRVGEVSSKSRITEQTYYRWRWEHGGMWVDQIQGLNELEIGCSLQPSGI